MRNRNDAMLTGLTPFFEYIFYITSQNKVSQMDDNVDNRTTVVNVTTLEGGQFTSC